MDRVGGTPAERRPSGWLFAASVQVVAALGWLAPGFGWLPGEGVGGPPSLWPRWLAALLLLGNAVFVAALAMGERRQAQQLREALCQERGRLHDLEDLVEGWQWRTDADHRLIHLRPPRGTPPARGDCRQNQRRSGPTSRPRMRRRCSGRWSTAPRSTTLRSFGARATTPLLPSVPAVATAGLPACCEAGRCGMRSAR